MNQSYFGFGKHRKVSPLSRASAMLNVPELLENCVEILFFVKYYVPLVNPHISEVFYLKGELQRNRVQKYSSLY